MSARLKTIKITIIYDNTLWKQDLVCDWGFSCLIEAHGKSILFDTGAKGQILLSNMEKLGISPSEIDAVFISHDHWDHVDGLPYFLRLRNVDVFCPESFPETAESVKLKRVGKPVELFENIFSTGELGEDDREQSLLIKNGNNITVVVGCSHPGVDMILKNAADFGNVTGIIGGFHDFTDISTLKGLDIICPTHCSVAIDEIRKRYPEKFIEGGAGKSIEF